MISTGFPLRLNTIDFNDAEAVSTLAPQTPNLWDMVTRRPPAPPVRSAKPNTAPTGIRLATREIPIAVNPDPEDNVVYEGETAYRNEQAYQFRDKTRVFVANDPQTPGDKIYRIHSGETDANGRPKTVGVIKNGRFYYVEANGQLHPEQGFLRNDPLLPPSVKAAWTAIDKHMNTRRADDVITANPNHFEVFGRETARLVQETIDAHNVRPNGRHKIPTQGWRLAPSDAFNGGKDLLDGPNGYRINITRLPNGDREIRIFNLFVQPVLDVRRVIQTPLM